MPSNPRETADPDGRRVVFDERTERHLARRRPQMLEHMSAILDAVRRPDIREADPARLVANDSSVADRVFAAKIEPALVAA